MLPIIAAIVLCSPGDAYRAAWADYQLLPLEERSVAYLSLHEVEEAKRPLLTSVTSGIVCSLTRETHLPSIIPQRVTGQPLLRIDLHALGWQDTYGQALCEARYPYYGQPHHRVLPPSYPLVVSALWFVAVIPDADKSGAAQDLLLYGAKPPKTVEELLKIWKVNTDKPTVWGFLEGKSGVANNSIRTIQSYPMAAVRQGYAWITYDFVQLKKETDPLENLRVLQHDGKGFDASEIIIAKAVSDASEYGVLQVYALCDARGQLQRKAPTNIVTDHSSTRGPEIINFVSCVSCHTQGIIPTSVNEFQTLLSSDATVYAKDKHDRDAAERFLENAVATEIEANQRMYERGVMMATGLKAEKFSVSFVSAVKRYHAPVSLAQAARELETTAETVRLALGWYAVTYPHTFPARVVQLERVPMPRERWEDEGFQAVLVAVQKWESQK